MTTTTTCVCAMCGQRFRPCEGETVHLQLTAQIDKATGASTPIHEWMDFCSEACLDVMLKRGTTATGAKFETLPVVG